MSVRPREATWFGSRTAVPEDFRVRVRRGHGRRSRFPRPRDRYTPPTIPRPVRARSLPSIEGLAHAEKHERPEVVLPKIGELKRACVARPGKHLAGDIGVGSLQIDLNVKREIGLRFVVDVDCVLDGHEGAVDLIEAEIACDGWEKSVDTPGQLPSRDVVTEVNLGVERMLIVGRRDLPLLSRRRILDLREPPGA